MASSFFGLNIARSGMSTYNAWLNTTAHNISNVKTEGYTRQTVKQQATTPVSFGTSYGMMGTGVEAADIISERDEYYDMKYRLSNTNCGLYDTYTYYMQSIEDYFYAKDSESGGMTNALDGFFKSLINLTTDPANKTIRTEVIGDAELFTKYVQEAAYNLRTMQLDINDQIAKTVEQINAYGEEIASLNQQINTLEVYGSKANDLRDQRARLLDELSELVDVQVLEKTPEGGQGLSQYVVSIGGAKLVDTNENYTISCELQGSKNCQNDIDKLYDLRWSNGQDFDIHATDMGGKLQALFQLRDGNNGEVFSGTTTNAVQGSDTIVISDVNDLGSSILKLSIPSEDGVIHIGSARYQYESFTATVDDTGKYTYTFKLKDGVTVGGNAQGKVATISDAVDYRGIPYYMSQLNEFIRTFSCRFNEVQTKGLDLNGEQGIQMFSGTDTALGVGMYFDEEVDSGFSFSSAINPVTDINQDTGKAQTSYYRLTAFNTNIADEFLKNSELIACADEAGGVANGENLALMSALESDKTMFRQGQPCSFLQVLTSTVGVDSKKVRDAAENAGNIRAYVDNRRLSKAGVDEDEEAQNLVICQNLLTYQYKVLSVMNEVLDKLINGTAV